MKDNALYLEADEDITSAIDKLSKVADSSVQIVVPKRSQLLQSIINLKLLKKAADAGHKQLVLVTGDRIATELAGRVGLAVAPSLGAKAVVAEAAMPEDLKSTEEIIEASDPEPPRPTAPTPPPPPAKKRLPLLTRRKLTDDPPAPIAAPDIPGAADAEPADDAPAKTAGRPALKVPNWGRMQRRITWVSLALVLVAGYMAAMYLFTGATVVLYANGTKIDIDTSFTVDPAQKSTDKSKAVLAAQQVSVSKDLSGSFTATGKKDAGTKASGQMTIKNEYDTDTHPLQEGTRFVAPDGKVFRTTEATTIPGLTVAPGPIIVPGSVTVGVIADQAGDSYNEGPAKYTIPGYSGTMQQKIYGQGGQMSGGTTKTVTIVTQSDVDAAKTELLDKDKDNATRDLDGRLPSGYVALAPSRATATGDVSPSPAIDTEATTATLSLKVTYTVLAVKQSEYEELVQAQEQAQIGAQNQIYDNGLDNAQLTVTDKDASGRSKFHLTTEAYGGPKLDKAAIAKQLGGHRYGDALEAAEKLPGVNRAEITITPGWATSLPRRADKITVTIQVAGAK